MTLLSACGLVDAGPESPADPAAPNQTPIATPVTESGGGYPSAAFAARDMLAEMLGIAPEDAEILDIQPVDWPDACLGIETEEVCAQGITPGYLVDLRVGTARYEFHTNADGSLVRKASEAHPDTGGEEVRFALTWQGPQEAFFAATLETAFYRSSKDSALVAAPSITKEQLQALSEWVQRYAAFEVETKAGRLMLNGFGVLVATEAEQRMLAEWARLNFELAQTGSLDPAEGLVLAWSRQGGIAGFCDDLGVYLDGRVVVSNCKTGEEPYPAFRLNATQLEQLYAWVDAYQSTEQVTTDPAQADGMTLRLYLYGEGEDRPDNETLRAISEFAAGLAAQASFQAQAPEDLHAAEESLEEFFQALSSGNYERAADLYGGETAVLEGYNPDLEGELAALLERACTLNGFQCLPVRSLTYIGSDVRGGCQFLVEFINPDGTLFRQGPCCGDETGLSTSSFLVSLIEQDGSWKVMNLPPYVP